MNKQSFKEAFADTNVETPVLALPPIDQIRKVYCSYGYDDHANWILPLGFKPTANIYAADVVIFGGGKDIDPGWYNEKQGPRTCSPSARDKEEKKDFETVQRLRVEGHEILSVGICRGAQLGCALSGGGLIQDVSNHCGDHPVATFDKQDFTVNSIHHQMLYPYKMERKDYKILAWTKKNISSKYLDGWNNEKWFPGGFKEIEIAYFPKTHFLAIQSHPEMMYRNVRYDNTIAWMQELFLKYYNNKK